MNIKNRNGVFEIFTFYKGVQASTLRFYGFRNKSLFESVISEFDEVQFDCSFYPLSIDIENTQTKIKDLVNTLNQFDEIIIDYCIKD